MWLLIFLLFFIFTCKVWELFPLFLYEAINLKFTNIPASLLHQHCQTPAILLCNRIIKHCMSILQHKNGNKVSQEKVSPA